MIKKLLFVFLVLANSLPSWGIGNICHRTQTVFSLASTAPAEQIINHEGLVYRLIRLDATTTGSKGFKAAIEYLNSDFIESLKHLGKDENFISKILEINKDLVEDSFILLSYDPTEPKRPLAGTALAIARKPGDLLPLEKELHVDFFSSALKVNYPIVEIARVGAKTPKTFHALIAMVKEIMKTSPEIQHFFGYTSRGHRALYRTYGHQTKELAKQENLQQLNSNDIIIEALR